MAKKGKFNLTQFLISLVFIILSVESVLTAAQLLLGGDINGVVGSALAIFMFLVGLLGILRVNIKVTRVFAVIVCVLAGASAIMAALAFEIKGAVFPLIEALLAWIYFDIS